MKLINGQRIAGQIKNRLKKEVQELSRRPSLQAINVGKDKLTQVFLREKEKACRETGIDFQNHSLPVDVREKEAVELIQSLNNDVQTTGILVQLPFPPQSSLNLTLLDQIKPEKDVDCLTALNFGRFITANPFFVPPTVQAVQQILEQENISLKGKSVTVVGVGRVAGLPIAIFLSQQGATVTMSHEFTRNIRNHTLKADIIVSAVGKPSLIKKTMIKKGAILIDVGTSWSEGKLVGDFDQNCLNLEEGKITPVPGGVGPVVVACLLRNVLQATKS